MRMGDAARLVEANPGKTVYGYRAARRGQWAYFYAAFRRAEKHGLIRGEANPTRKNSRIYFPA